MSEVTKFTEEELAELRGLQDGFNAIVIRFGQLSVEELNHAKTTARLAEAKEQVTAEFELLLQKEKEVAATLSNKYGPGTLNPQTGEFTAQPVETEVAPEAPVAVTE